MAKVALPATAVPNATPALWGRLPLAALDLAWAAPALGLMLALLGGDGARATGAAVALYLAGLVISLAGTHVPVPRRARRLATLALAGVAVVVAVWAVGHIARPFLDSVWIGEALAAMGEARLGVSPELVLLGAGPMLLWRGTWLARVLPTHTGAGASLQMGMIVVALGAIGGGQAYAGFALLWALAVLATGLLALVATRGVDANLGSAGARLWGLVFTAILLLAVYVLVSHGGAIAAALLDFATRLANAVAAAVGALFARLASLFPPDSSALPADAQPTNAGAREPAFANFFTVPESVRRLGGAAVMFGLITPLLIGAVRFLAEAYRRLWDPLFMAGMSVERGEGLGGDPRLWLRALLYRFGRLLWRGAGGQVLDGDPRAWPVRLAYRDLLKVAAKRGAPRRPGQTAAEHLSRLAATFPGHDAELETITAAYERARYGPSPEREHPSQLRALVHQVLRGRRRVAPHQEQASPR